MPGFDKTGPNGEGPMTGLGKGKCQADNKENTRRDLELPDGCQNRRYNRKRLRRRIQEKE